jgi:cleavage and polyadenylation specificity factor subunit 3
MFWINIGGRSLLYTGDYSMEDDRHLMAAEIPSMKPDVLVCESTFGVQVHASRAEREARFTGMIERVVTRGGRCLIPVFALGRAQELLLILDEYWQANPQLQNIPIWYASKMANRALRVYQTYSNMMNHRIRASMDVGNPFHFSYIQNLKSIDATSFPDTGPSVVFASPGMLQSGVSRQLFDRWAADAKNGVMIAGYAVEHTLAKEIMNQPKEVVTLEGKRQPLNCLVDYVSFAAHVDFVQNRSFIQKVDPRHIILVHGQKDEMGRLKSALNHYFRTVPENKRPTISMPPNAQDVTLKFARRRSAKVMGSLVESKKEPKEGDEVQGILVTQNFTSKIVRADELATYTPLRVGSISSRLHIPYVGSMETLKLILTEVFQGVAVTDTSTGTRFSLYENRVTLTFGDTKNMGILEWDASPASDTVADAIICLAMQAQTSNAAIRLTSKPCRHSRDTDDDGNNNTVDDNGDGPSRKKPREGKVSPTESKLRFLKHTLKDQFANVEAVYEGNSATYEIKTDTGLDSEVVLEDDEGLTCTVKVTFDDDTGGLASVKTECIDHKLAKNVQTCITNIATLMNPLKIPE